MTEHSVDLAASTDRGTVEVPVPRQPADAGRSRPWAEPDVTAGCYWDVAAGAWRRAPRPEG